MNQSEGFECRRRSRSGAARRSLPTESFAQTARGHRPPRRLGRVVVAAAVPAQAVAAAAPHQRWRRRRRYRGGGGADAYGGGGGGYHRHGGGGGFIPGAIAGAVIGGAIASQSRPYYGGGRYYGGGAYYGGSAYDYDDGYAEGPVVQVAPGGGGDDVAYCMQTYRSYDPRSGTYLGNDGYRHPCP